MRVELVGGGDVRDQLTVAKIAQLDPRVSRRL